jgi:putative transposase
MKEMPNYKRFYDGCVWFFTAVTYSRRPFLTSEQGRLCLRNAIEECRKQYPFTIEGWVLLPDHMHCVWHLPESDLDYSRRWSIIKRKFTQNYRQGQNLPPFWQKRFWAHGISDELDYANHMNYIHYNPVKHGYVKTPKEWPWTSFHCCVEAGIYSNDWGENVCLSDDVGNE